LYVWSSISNPDSAKAFQGEHSALLSELDTLYDTDTTILLSACKHELQDLLSRLAKQADSHSFSWHHFKAALDGRKAREAVENLHRRYLSLTLLYQADLATLQAKALREIKEAREDQLRIHKLKLRASMLSHGQRQGLNLASTPLSPRPTL